MFFSADWKVDSNTCVLHKGPDHRSYADCNSIHVSFLTKAILFFGEIQQQNYNATYNTDLIVKRIFRPEQSNLFIPRHENQID